MRAPDFSKRSLEAEWLDEPALTEEQLEPVLRDLAKLNGAAFGYWPVLRWIGKATKGLSDAGVCTVLDVGCGYGDLLRAMRQWARRRNVALRLIGIDLSRETIRIAKAATPDDDQIEFLSADVFDWHPSCPVDFVVSSLLTHHFSDSQIVSFLQWMEATARRGWLIYDLQRHIMPYLFIATAGTLARLHPMVVHDGKISVTRSLTRREWRERIASAGLRPEEAHVHWFMYRLVIEHLRCGAPKPS